jgi:hypothetical protein
VLILVSRFQFCNSRIVSILTSCERLPATVPDLANRPRQLVFLTPIDSQLNDFLNEIHQIARFEPSIVERIDEDLDLHAKKKKLLRLADAQFLAVWLRRKYYQGKRLAFEKWFRFLLWSIRRRIGRLSLCAMMNHCGSIMAHGRELRIYRRL